VEIERQRGGARGPRQQLGAREQLPPGERHRRCTDLLGALDQPEHARPVVAADLDPRASSLHRDDGSTEAARIASIEDSAATVAPLFKSLPEPCGLLTSGERPPGPHVLRPYRRILISDGDRPL